jgi:F-type H+-transporting ATPase subunit gamma
MMAMASAKTNIETKLGTLLRRERQLRQEEITTEIVELAAGAEASQSSHSVRRRRAKNH